MSDDDEKTLVELSHEKAFCPWHLERFRAEWPRGYAVALVLTFTAFASLPEIQAYAHGNTGALNAALAEFGPMCSQLDPKLVDEIIDVALDGDVVAFRLLRQRIIDEAIRRHES